MDRPVPKAALKSFVLQRIVFSKWAKFTQGEYGSLSNYYEMQRGWNIYKKTLKQFNTDPDLGPGDYACLARMMLEVQIEYNKVQDALKVAPVKFRKSTHPDVPQYLDFRPLKQKYSQVLRLYKDYKKTKLKYYLKQRKIST